MPPCFCGVMSDVASSVPRLPSHAPHTPSPTQILRRETKIGSIHQLDATRLVHLLSIFSEDGLGYFGIEREIMNEVVIYMHIGICCAAFMSSSFHRRAVSYSNDMINLSLRRRSTRGVIYPVWCHPSSLWFNPFPLALQILNFSSLQVSMPCISVFHSTHLSSLFSCMALVQVGAFYF